MLNFLFGQPEDPVHGRRRWKQAGWQSVPDTETEGSSWKSEVGRAAPCGTEGGTTRSCRSSNPTNVHHVSWIRSRQLKIPESSTHPSPASVSPIPLCGYCDHNLCSVEGIANPMYPTNVVDISSAAEAPSGPGTERVIPTRRKETWRIYIEYLRCPRDSPGFTNECW